MDESLKQYINEHLYNPDGTMTEAYKQRLLAKGKSPEDIAQLERLQMKDIQERIERDERWFRLYGVTYAEHSQTSQLSEEVQLHRQKQALQEGMPIDELPLAIEPDEYPKTF